MECAKFLINHVVQTYNFVDPMRVKLSDENHNLRTKMSYFTLSGMHIETSEIHMG